MYNFTLPKNGEKENERWYNKYWILVQPLLSRMEPKKFHIFLFKSRVWLGRN